ncbi:MAG: transporter substrate-binding domain-containing protein [Bdellovibrio sp.]|nr:transporter substrate-binding domain-containing protein [Bdellovibrio sp.]
MKLRRLILLSASLSLSLTSTASALCNRVYVWGLATNSITEKEKTISISQLASALSNEIKKRMDCIFTDIPMTFEKVPKEFRNHRIDGFAFTFVHSSLTENADTLVLYRTQRILLLAKKYYRPGITVSQYLHDKSLRFAAVTGGRLFFLPEEIDYLRKQKRLIENPFPDDVAGLVANGKAQATITSPSYLTRYHKDNLFQDKLVEIPDPDGFLDIALFLSKKRINAAEKAKFIEVIDQMKKDGTIKKVLLNYVSEDYFNKYYQIDVPTLPAQTK